MKLVFGCGGTGGHIYPALALAREFGCHGHHSVVFIGNRDGMEAELVKRESYDFYPIRVRKLSRGWDVSLLGFPFHLLASVFKCLAYYRRFRPDAVICTGGFVSGPVGLAAVLGRVPLFFHESNSLPGLTTRFLARYTRMTFISWEAARARLPKAPLMMAGIPLMPRGQAPGQESPDLADFGLDASRPLILVSGGSQGSQAINSAVEEALELILERGWQLVWQTGKAGYAHLAPAHKARAGVWLFDFSPLLPLFYPLASVAVTRAGAMTIAEQEAARVPAILIPLPGAADNHQLFNALEQQKKGVARCLEQKDLNPHGLIARIAEILEHRDEYHKKLEAIPPNHAAMAIRAQVISMLAKETHHVR